jgi:hypothetical protein
MSLNLKRYQQEGDVHFHSLSYACQVNPQLPQVVGFRPANKANSPTGKTHMETMMAHVGKPPCEVIVLHLGQETTAMKISL